jgi:alpha-tubulin suppressor-like RCC1 family protein
VPSLGGATAIGAGVSHACAVVANGAVRCWGANGAGQVTGTSSSAPVLAPAATPVTSGALAVVAGAGHTCALLAGGAVRCWGGGFVDRPIDAGATALAAGRGHACAVVAGAVRCWGENGTGQLGNGSQVTSPAPVVTIPSGVALVGAGADQACAATATPTGQPVENALLCWGDSLGATFGLASPQLVPAIPRRDPDRATIRNPVGLLAVGRKHVCVRDRAEAVECLGLNDRGQLGGAPLGDAAGEAVTVPMPAVASALAAGADHTCAIVSGGRIRCWGANESGQLGNGATGDPGVGVIVAPVGR